MMAQLPLPSLLAPTCTEATNLAPFAGLTGFSPTGPNAGGPQWFLPLPPSPAGSTVLSGFSGGALSRICTSCDPTSCVILTDGDWTWAAGQTVSVAVDPFPPGSYFQISVDWF
jgi:hypothetical protein